MSGITRHCVEEDGVEAFFPLWGMTTVGRFKARCASSAQMGALGS